MIKLFEFNYIIIQQYWFLVW